MLTTVADARSVYDIFKTESQGSWVWMNLIRASFHCIKPVYIRLQNIVLLFLSDYIDVV